MRSKSFPLLLAISLLILLLDKKNLITVIKAPFEQIVVPFKKNVYQSIYHLRFFPTVFMSYGQLLQEKNNLADLKRQKDELNLKLQLQAAENEDLRRQLGSSLPTSYRYIPAPVIGLSRFLEIAAGSQEGVGDGMPVVVGDVFIGNIINVSKNRSLVRLITDKDMKVTAKTNRGTFGEVIGRVGQSILFDKVLQKDPLFLDDLVVTRGTDGLPPNLLIGKISHIKSDDAAVYKEAVIEALVDITQKQNILIISAL